MRAWRPCPMMSNAKGTSCPSATGEDVSCHGFCNPEEPNKHLSLYCISMHRRRNYIHNAVCTYTHGYVHMHIRGMFFQTDMYMYVCMHACMHACIYIIYTCTFVCHSVRIRSLLQVLCLACLYRRHGSAALWWRSAPQWVQCHCFKK